MPNKFPVWKNALIIVVVALGFIYAGPNIYPPDPAVQLSGQSGAMLIDQAVLDKASAALHSAEIDYFGGESDGESALLRLNDIAQQLRAKEVIQAEMGGDFIVALNLAQTTPRWLSSLGASPMKLGLDLSGGVHFLLEVDLDAAIKTRLEGHLEDVKVLLRKNRIRYRSFALVDDQIVGQFRDLEQSKKAESIVRKEFSELQPRSNPSGNPLSLSLRLSEMAKDEIEDNTIKQNLTSAQLDRFTT